MNINNVVLVGRLTKDPELRKTSNNTSTCNVTLAVNRRFSKDDTDFINVVAWRQSADFLCQYARKGSIVGVEGRIQTRNYEDNKGNKVYVTEVVADQVQLVNNKNTTSTTNEEPKPRYESYQQPLDSSVASVNDKEFERGSRETLDIASDDLPFY